MAGSAAKCKNIAPGHERILRLLKDAGNFRQDRERSFRIGLLGSSEIVQEIQWGLGPQTEHACG